MLRTLVHGGVWMDQRSAVGAAPAGLARAGTAGDVDAGRDGAVQADGLIGTSHYICSPSDRILRLLARQPLYASNLAQKLDTPYEDVDACLLTLGAEGKVERTVNKPFVWRVAR